MIRTKHLFVLGVFLVFAASTGLVSTLVLNGFQSVPAGNLEASVLLGVPAESYSLITEEETDTRSTFVEKLRNAYVPPPVVQESVIQEPVNPEPAFAPEPEPGLLPVAVVEESFDTHTEVASSSSVEEVTTPISMENDADTASSTGSSNI